MGRRYREIQIQTASPVGLVVQMYEGAIRQIRVARSYHEQGRIAERAAAISRALAIVAELRDALDRERGGEIAANLDSLYLFVNERLVEMNVGRRMEAGDEAIAVLEPLREAWAEIATRPVEDRRAETA